MVWSGRQSDVSRASPEEASEFGEATGTFSAQAVSPLGTFVSQRDGEIYSGELRKTRDWRRRETGNRIGGDEYRTALRAEPGHVLWHACWETRGSVCPLSGGSTSACSAI